MTVGIKEDNGGEGLIFIADRMITYTEFGVKTEISKIEEIRN